MEHKDADCTGLWSQRTSGEWMYWECGGCGAIADHSVEVAEAALREKQIGTTMQRLADAGEWLIVDQTEDLGS